MHTGGHMSAILVDSSSLTIINSTVTDNTVSAGVKFGQISIVEGGLWLQGTRIARNSAPVLMQRTDDGETGSIVSDAPLSYRTGKSGGPFRYKAAAQALLPGDDFLDGSEPWFVSTLEVSFRVDCMLTFGWWGAAPLLVCTAVLQTSAHKTATGHL